jgi:hypothetical protein
VTDDMTVTSRSASLPTQDMSGRGLRIPNHVKPKIIAYHLCHVTLNQKWSPKF